MALVVCVCVCMFVGACVCERGEGGETLRAKEAGMRVSHTHTHNDCTDITHRLALAILVPRHDARLVFVATSQGEVRGCNQWRINQAANGSAVGKPA